MTKMNEQAPPLANFEIVGMIEKTIGINAGTPHAKIVAGGTCWHCGTGIRYVVLAKNKATGEVVDIGTTCAERIGLDRKQLKAMLAEKFAEQRWLASKAHRDAQQAEYEAKEAEFEALYGPHGTVGRHPHCNVWGIPGACDECRAVAPHGTLDRFYDGECSCAECVKCALASGNGLEIREMPVLVDLATGQVVDAAKVINGQYGLAWLIPDFYGQGYGNGKFVPYGKVRRDTVAKRGYTYATAEYIGYKPRRAGEGFWKLRRLTTPTVDEWGEPIPVN